MRLFDKLVKFKVKWILFFLLVLLNNSRCLIKWALIVSFRVQLFYVMLQEISGNLWSRKFVEMEKWIVIICLILFWILILYIINELISYDAYKVTLLYIIIFIKGKPTTDCWDLGNVWKLHWLQFLLSSPLTSTHTENLHEKFAFQPP